MGTTQEAPCAHSEAEQMGELRVPQLSLLPERLRAAGGTPPCGLPSMVAMKFHTRDTPSNKMYGLSSLFPVILRQGLTVTAQVVLELTNLHLAQPP